MDSPAASSLLRRRSTPSELQRSSGLTGEGSGAVPGSVKDTCSLDSAFGSSTITSLRRSPTGCWGGLMTGAVTANLPLAGSSMVAVIVAGSCESVPFCQLILG